MKKFPKPWFRPERGVWYVTLNGRQHNLGPNKVQAFDLYKRLIATPTHTVEVGGESLAVIIDRFLEWVSKNRAPDTYEWYQYRLQRFLRKFPTMRAVDLRPYHVEQWADGYKFSATSRRNYMRTVKRCMSWATKQGYLDRNPIAALEMPPEARREVSLSDSEIELLLANIRDQSLRDLIVVTMESGCRPQESLRVEARHVDFVNQRWVFPKSESKNKKLSRVVYLTDKAMDIVRRLASQNPTGKLFRNILGKPWTTEAVNCAFTRVQIRIGTESMKKQGLAVSEEAIAQFIPTLKKQHRQRGKLVDKTPYELREEARTKLRYRMACNLAPKWSLYALRHTWATRALQTGVDPLTVAILMGHSDPSMLSRVYQHVSLNPTHMLDQAKRAVK